MIYFDENQQAYAFEIQNPVATCEDELWAKLAPLGEEAWAIEDGEIVDKTFSQEYIIIQENKRKEFLKSTLKLEIEELDIKRIRAFLEPSTRTDGTSWLEYYTNQIIEKREKLAQF